MTDLRAHGGAAGSEPDGLIAQADAYGREIDAILRAARELLGMEIGWIAEFRAGRQVYRALDGDIDSFGFHHGQAMPLDATFCHRMTVGRIPSAVPDTAREPEVADLDLTRDARIGSYLGVPIALRDGTLYGTLCVASHRPQRRLSDRDVRFLQGLAARCAAALEDARADEPIGGAA